jgi:hypothetical protein
MARNLDRTADEMRDAILDELRSHSRGVVQADDVTLIVARVLAGISHTQRAETSLDAAGTSACAASVLQTTFGHHQEERSEWRKS